MPKSEYSLLNKQDEKSLTSVPVLGQIGYSIQIGAFSAPENAMRMEEALRTRGLDAYFFRHESGLYKVRFGNYPTHEDAGREAARLRESGQIEEFIIVLPETDAAPGIIPDEGDELRRKLVHTAVRFLGVSYARGGESVDEGFDCSGLTMAVYRLNGLNLPRESVRQFGAGRPVGRQDLKTGDLVFFAMNSGRAVSHVGLYVGEGKFIHAPRPGKTVRFALLDSIYFKERFVGGRSYF